MVAKSRLAEVVRHIGANTSRLRKKLGLTQAELAEAADLDLRYIQRIERGTARPTIATVIAIADAMETPVSSLFRPAKQPKAKTGRPPKRRSGA